jgi:hypothetical protein
VEEHLRPALKSAITLLEHLGYQYAVIGGIALSQWEVARFTHNIDIKVLVPGTDYANVRNELRADFPERARDFIPENPFIVAVNIQGVIVDFLLTLPGYEQLIVERAVQRDLGGFQVWICSAENLIIQKVIAGRGKDWLDIEALLIEQHGKLDTAYIEDWLVQFAEALEKPELLSEYHHLRDKINSYPQ